MYPLQAGQNAACLMMLSTLGRTNCPPALYFAQAIQALMTTEPAQTVRRPYPPVRSIAQIGLDDLGVGLDLGGQALGQQHAVVEHVDALADAHDQLHVVLD